MERDLSPIPPPLPWPVGLTATGFAGLIGLASGSVVPLYYPILLAFGALGWRHRRALLRFGGLGQRVALGYLAVIAEETLAGLLHGLAEGGGPLILAERVGQFIAFNLPAFTGIILSLAFWRRRVIFQPYDLFLAAGCWGLFAEGSLQALIANPLAGALLILPTMAVYAVILWPMTAAPAPQAKRNAFRLPLIWATAFALSLAPIGAVSWARALHPGWFPACTYIAC